jgi:hypothetical protein
LGFPSLNGFKKSAVLYIHFLLVAPIRLIVDLDLALDFDQDGNLNIDEEVDLGAGVEAPKNELERVSISGFDVDPNGHHEEDLDSCAKSEFDEKKTRTKPSIAIRCAFMASLPY